MNVPPFWLVLKVNEDAVVTYFHCRYELARPEELLQCRQIHEDLLNSITVGQIDESANAAQRSARYEALQRPIGPGNQ